jgi:hypothetical protein
VRGIAALAPALLLAAAAAGCAGTRKPHDYGAFLDHMPRSILVLPPLNESPEVNASYAYMSTLTRPLVERGYYVFPVAVVDACMRENGCPTAGEMHQVPPDRLRAVFGCDAVLYITLREWGNKYEILSSVAEVSVKARLVDCVSGETIWEGTGRAAESSSQGADNPLAMLVAAVVTQVASTTDGRSLTAARRANSFFLTRTDGLLLGPRHADFEKDQAARREEREKAAAARP